MGRARVANRMQVLGLKARAANNYKATPPSKHRLPGAPNRLEPDVTARAPNPTWGADLTTYQFLMISPLKAGQG